MGENLSSYGIEKGAIQAPFSVFSHAKLNLSLLIYAPRRDGYHPICSVFQEISLHDVLEITPQKRGVFSVDIPGSPINGQPNILHKVIDKLGGHLRYGYHVTIRKNIPIGGGLGGGSSNAAAFLKWLVSYEQLTLSDREIHRIATSLGADVPFFLTGGTALVRGIGERVCPLPQPSEQWYVLINPGVHAPTQTIYRDYDQQSGRLRRPGPTPKRILAGAIGENQFKSVVWKRIPELGELEARMLTELNYPLYLSGSGATVYVVVARPDDATQVLDWVKRQYPSYWVHLSRNQRNSVQYSTRIETK